MKRFFHSELEQFRSNLVLMAERCLEIVRMAERSLFDGSVELAKEVIACDDSIDQLEMVLDAEGIRYISMRAPVAKDLRLLTVGMKTSRDLERVADEATSIARRVIKLDATLPVREFHNLPEMFLHTHEMLRDAIDSFLEGDASKAIAIPARDKLVDRLNKDNYALLSRQIAADPSQVDRFLELIFISKSVERIADHASNIAEEVVYLYKGEDVRHSPVVKDQQGEPR